LLTDSVSDNTRASRGAVRFPLLQLGTRTFVLTTFNADGTRRGSFTRAIPLY
jgi:hypothetical protein